MDVPCLIRPATGTDVGALVALEQASFTDPWSAGSFLEAVTDSGQMVLVAEEGRGSHRDIVGYIIARVVAGVGEILNLAVETRLRRRRIAATLLDAALSTIDQLGAAETFLEVRESNSAALALYGARGFHTVGMRPAYYRSPKEDALVLRRGPRRGA